ncbi:MAG: Gfo/Idh/MocA family oxidoreductase [Planctomycetes bacterium]|nr:Gfo/Idh/MocA family oxidoreductase [Planctomycetota bacterium]
MAVIGVGHLGKEHARILASLPDVELVGVADVNAEQVQAVARRLGVPAFTEYWPLLNLVDAATVVVPTRFHFQVAAEFLRRGIPLLVEKPLAAALDEAETLAEMAARHGAALQVGHIERFNPAFEDLVSRPLQPKFITCERLGPFTGRSTDIGVVHDLMIHDLDLLLTLVGAPVVSVEALGVSLFGPHEDVASARLHFANGCVANVTASRASAAPCRKMHVWAPEGYARLDYQKRTLTLVQPSALIRQQGLDPNKLEPALRATLRDDLFTKHFERVQIDGHGQDQLTCELRHFIQCVRTGSRPRVNGADACAALRVAQRILECVRSHAWNGDAVGPVGPSQLPTPIGPLFADRPQQDAA